MTAPPLRPPLRPLSHPPAWQIAVGFAILYIVWGTTYLAIRIGVLDEHLPPLLFGGSRIGAAGLVLLLFQLLRGQSIGFSRRDAVGILCGAGFLFVGGNGLITIALQTVPSGESAILAATASLWIALVSMLFPGGDRLRAVGWLGLILGLVGVVILQSPKLDAAELAHTGVAGPLFNLASAACWGVGTVVLRQTPVRIARLTSAGWQMTLGGLAMILLGVCLGETPPERVTGKTIATFVYLLVMGSLIAFVAFHWLLEHVSAPSVGTYAYVNPLVAVLLGLWWHGEAITLPVVFGMLLILMGVFLVRGDDRSLARERPLPAPSNLDA